MRTRDGVDRFGNTIDPDVGYARGSILAGSTDERARGARAAELMRRRAERLGADALFIFTGTEPRPATAGGAIGSSDTDDASDELRSRALDLLGGGSDHAVALFTRTSSGIVAAALALARAGESIVSLVPAGRSHPSVARGARLCGATLVECTDADELADALHGTHGRFAVITGVTSEIAVLPEPALARAVEEAHRAGRVCLVDDAYGALVRTVLCGQRPALALQADLVIMSTQKAGLGAVRGGLMAGARELVDHVVARGSELGLEAAGCATLPVLHALREFSRADVTDIAAAGADLYNAMARVFDPARITRTLLGPIIDTDELLAIALERAGRDTTSIVPAEAGAALGMILLEDSGLVTVNAVGAPGARLSLRPKCTRRTLLRFGGADAVAAALDRAFDRLAGIIGEPQTVRTLLIGPAGVGARDAHAAHPF